MAPQPSRWPTFLDGLILVSVLLGAIAVSRIDPHAIESRLGLPPTSIPPFASAMPKPDAPWTAWTKWLLRGALLSGTPILVLITPGIAVATFRTRSMYRKRSFRSVGVLTTAITGPMIVVYLINDLVLRRLSETLGGYGNNVIWGIWSEIADQVAVAVLALWIVLALGRRWHAEPHWRDRLGRALGIAWFAYLILAGILAPLWLYR